MKSLLGLLVAGAVGSLGAMTYLPGEGNFEVSVYQTTGTRPFREIRTTPFTSHAYTNRAPIAVDAAVPHGTFSWLGVSLTDASAWLLSSLPAEKRRAILEAVFSPTKGAGVRGVRLNIGASDYSTAIYNYNEWAGDVEMAKFSMSRDDNWLFPTLREVKAVNTNLCLFAAAWSCPGWMKTTGNFIDGALKEGYEQPLANYLAAYAAGCRDRGFPLDAISINNEAGLSTRGTYPALVISPEQEAKTAKLLRKRLDAKGLSCGIWLLDWNYDKLEKRVLPQLADPETVAAVQGVAWHSYFCSPKGVWEAKQRYPKLRFFHTEQGPARHDASRTVKWWTNRLKDAFEAGCESFTSWNLCLDENDGPLTGPHLCAGLVTADSETGDFTPSAQYHVFRHIGPFVKPGAEVLKFEGADTDDLAVILFRNPDGEYVLVAACDTGRGATGRLKADGSEPRPKLYVSCHGEMKHLPLPYGTWSVTTMVFKRKTGFSYQLDRKYGPRGDAPGEGAAYPDQKSFLSPDGKAVNVHRSGQTYDLVLPRHPIPRAPVVVFIHGGAWCQRWDKGSYTPGLPRVLADRGLVAVSANYQLQNDLTEHPFADRRENATFADMLRDIDALLAHLADELPRQGLSASSVILVGGSAGAHLATLYAVDEGNPAALGLNLRHRLPVALAVSQAGPVDLADPYYVDALLGLTSMGAMYARLFSWLTGEYEFSLVGRDRAKVTAALTKWSPVTHVTARTPPCALLYTRNPAGAADDGLVPVSSMEKLRDRLTAAGVRVWSRVDDGVGHCQYNPEADRWLVDLILGEFVR